MAIPTAAITLQATPHTLAFMVAFSIFIAAPARVILPVISAVAAL
jgi:hypothetical protein